jgi:hypothetical protein
MADTDTPDFTALAEAWTRFAAVAGIPADYHGDSTPAAHEGVEVAQHHLRQHILSTNDYRLFPLLHILGNAAVRMEQVLDPQGYAESVARVSAALAKAELHATQGEGEPIDKALATSLLRRD